MIGCVTPFNRSDWLCAGPAGGDGATQGDVPVPRPDWPAAGVRAHQPGDSWPQDASPEKAMVAASVWGPEFIQFLAALTICIALEE